MGIRWQSITNMQKDLLRQDVNQQLSGREFDNCSFYHLKKNNTYLCLHKGDCWENSFVVFQKDDEIKITKGKNYEWLDTITTNRGKMAEWFDAEEINVINGTEVTSVEINEKLKNAVLKCLEEISSK